MLQTAFSSQKHTVSRLRRNVSGFIAYIYKIFSLFRGEGAIPLHNVLCLIFILCVWRCKKSFHDMSLVFIILNLGWDQISRWMRGNTINNLLRTPSMPPTDTHPKCFLILWLNWKRLRRVQQYCPIKIKCEP